MDITEHINKVYESRVEILLQNLGDLYENFYTGSRIICNPPVMNTDLDVIFLVDNNHSDADGILKEHGVYQVEFSEDEYDNMHENFTAYRLHYLNIIICNNEKFFERFKIATQIAKDFNLLKKEDRITLFQAIIYQQYDGEKF